MRGALLGSCYLVLCLGDMLFFWVVRWLVWKIREGRYVVGGEELGSWRGRVEKMRNMDSLLKSGNMGRDMFVVDSEDINLGWVCERCIWGVFVNSMLTVDDSETLGCATLGPLL